MRCSVFHPLNLSPPSPVVLGPSPPLPWQPVTATLSPPPPPQPPALPFPPTPVTPLPARPSLSPPHAPPSAPLTPPAVRLPASQAASLTFNRLDAMFRTARPGQAGGGGGSRFPSSSSSSSGAGLGAGAALALHGLGRSTRGGGGGGSVRRLSTDSDGRRAPLAVRLCLLLLLSAPHDRTKQGSGRFCSCCW